MKMCSSCGGILDDNAKFCIDCGGVAAEVEGGTPAQMDYSDVPLISHSAVCSALRERAKSPLFLVATIVATICALMAIINLFHPIPDVTAYNEMLAELGMELTVTTTPVATLIYNVPIILVAIGAWMLYGSAAGSDDRMSAAGLTVVKVGVIIGLVLCCLLSGLLVLAFAVIALGVGMLGVLDYSEYMMSEIPEFEMDAYMAVFTIVLAVMFVIVVAAIVFAIIYYAKALKAIGVMKHAIMTGEIRGKIPAFVGVMAIIIGATSSLSAILSVFSLQPLYIAWMVCNALLPILFGCVLFSCRKAVRSINH